MSVEWVAVLVVIVAVGFTTTAAVVTGFCRLNDRIDAGLAEATRERAEIRERLAHLEGTLDVLRSYFVLDSATKAPPDAPARSVSPHSGDDQRRNLD